MRLFFSLSFLILLSCSSPEQNLIVYYDLDHLLNQQAEMATNRGVKLKKHIVKGSNREEQLITMDSALWENEFRLFREFNPSNPKYVQAFDVVTDKNGTSYHLREGRPGALKTFSIDTVGDSVFCSGRFYEDKAIFTQERKMKLVLITDLLNQLEMEVLQVRYPSDSLKFSIKSTVIR